MNKILKWFVSIPAIIAGTVLVFIMLLTTIDVIFRFFFNAPITGASEITQRFIIFAGFLGMGWCALNNQHIKVGLIIDRLSPGMQKFFDIVNFIIVGIVGGIISKESFKQALLVKKMNVQSQLLGIPNFPFYIVVSISYLILTITIVFLLVYKILNKDILEKKNEC
ncbi:MAG: TRAP transporter small permease [Spirochaetales bacterium]|nr:TRAP transporter small permease [Spirochaetales bacterium]